VKDIYHLHVLVDQKLGGSELTTIDSIPLWWTELPEEHQLTDEEMWKMLGVPKRTCQCCGGEGVHQIFTQITPYLTVRHTLPCGECDENGMVLYMSFN